MTDLYEEARKRAEQAARNGQTRYDNSQDHQKTAQQRQADQKAWADANKK